MYYVITGVDRAGKRFRKVTDNLAYALGHNVWNGTLWQVDDKGKKTRIHKWYN
jgi:hypothetical protein